MSRQVASPKGAKAKADKYFSLIVRSRGACQNCGLTTNLQCAHIMSRRFNNTRCDERNALCLCAGCHHFYIDHPVAFGMWVVPHVMSSAEYAYLFSLAHGSAMKVDWVEVAARLSEQWKALSA